MKNLIYILLFLFISVSYSQTVLKEGDSITFQGLTIKLKSEKLLLCAKSSTISLVELYDSNRKLIMKESGKISGVTAIPVGSNVYSIRMIDREKKYKKNFEIKM